MCLYVSDSSVSVCFVRASDFDSRLLGKDPAPPLFFGDVVCVIDRID